MLARETTAVGGRLPFMGREQEGGKTGRAGRDFGDCSAIVIGACIEVHSLLGPGLLESAYEECLCQELTLRGLSYERQVTLPVKYKGTELKYGYRMDLVVERAVVVEVKAVDQLLPVHEAQALTYLKLSGLPTVLLVNFHTAVLRHGLRRLTWNNKTFPPFPSSRLPV